MDVTGKTVVITGASRGIGKQLAVELGRRGANIVVAARTVEPHRRLPGSIGQTVDEITAAGGGAIAVQADIAVPADIEALVRQAIERFGGIDVLVNNAADTGGGAPPMAELDRAAWLRQFDTNLHGPFSLIRAVLPSMTSRGGGVIVNMTSAAADLRGPTASADDAADPVGVGEQIAYAASKAALNRLADVIAPELRGLGIAIVSVDPGFTRTELVDLLGQRGVVDADAAVPMEVPVKTVLHVVTSDDPMRYSSTILRAAAFVEEHGL